MASPVVPRIYYPNDRDSDWASARKMLMPWLSVAPRRGYVGIASCAAVSAPAFARDSPL